MTPILDNAVLSTDLDCQNYDLKNVGLIDPVPDNLVALDDPRLTDGRAVPDGSVTNEMVNSTAAIDQGKLNFNGMIPTDWLGDGASLAAEGSQTEFTDNKGVPNGYASLDGNGKIHTALVDSGAAVGSVSSVGISMFPHTSLYVTHSPVTDSGNLQMAWHDAPHNSWFGSDGTVFNDFIQPFYVNAPFDTGLIVGLPASKFTSGTFARVLFPVAKPLGTGHSRGMVPDPGVTGSGNMYLGRDMQYHHFVVNDPATAYQPDVPDVTIVLDWWNENQIFITIRSLLKGSKLFYRVTPSGNTPGRFVEVHHPHAPDDPHVSLKVNEHDFVEAYAARQGYNNSKVEEWEVITPITDLGL